MDGLHVLLTIYSLFSMMPHRAERGGTEKNCYTIRLSEIGPWEHVFSVPTRVWKTGSVKVAELIF